MRRSHDASIQILNYKRVCLIGVEYYLKLFCDVKRDRQYVMAVRESQCAFLSAQNPDRLNKMG
jgi:hypothetical protein